MLKLTNILFIMSLNQLFIQLSTQITFDQDDLNLNDVGQYIEKHKEHLKNVLGQYEDLIDILWYIRDKCECCSTYTGGILIDDKNYSYNTTLEIDVRTKQIEDELENFIVGQNSASLVDPPEISRTYSLDRLVIKHRKLMSEMKHLKQMQMITNKFVMKRLKKKIVRALEIKKTTQVVELLTTTEEEEVCNLIEEICAMDIERNFDPLLDIAALLSDVKKLSIFRALVKVDEARGNIDALRMVKLMQSIKSALDGGSFGKENVRQEAQSLVSILRTKLASAGKEHLYNRYINMDFSNITDPKEQLIEQIYELDKELFQEIFRQFISVMYRDRQVSAEQLIRLSRSLGHIEQVIMAYSDMLTLMKNSNDTNSNVVINFAYSFREICLDYEYLTKEVQNSLEILLALFPESVRVLVFAENVCIKNVGKNEYLYSHNISKNNRRFVLSLTSEVTKEAIDWEIHRVEQDVYNIENVKYGEFMFSMSDGSVEYRSVITRKPAGHQNTLGFWQIIPEGDYCYFKYTLHNEYMCLTHSLLTIDRHSPVMLGGNYGKINHKYCLWKIEDCSE